MNGFLEGLQWLVANEHWSGADGIPHRVWEHVQVSFIALAIAAAIAVPLGLWVGPASATFKEAGDDRALGRAHPPG